MQGRNDPISLDYAASVNNSTLLMLTPYKLCFSLVDTTLPALHIMLVSSKIKHNCFNRE